MNLKIALLPGDGIGPEVIREAVKVCNAISKKFGHNIVWNEELVGAAAIEKTGDPYPKRTHEICLESDAVLFGAVGDPKFDNNPSLSVRPEEGLLRMRKKLGLYANLRPTFTFKPLLDMSPIKRDVIQGTDLIFVRELTGGIYFGKRGKNADDNYAYDTCEYNKDEIERIAKIGFELAGKRSKKMCCIDKANVLETSRLWRKTVQDISIKHPSIELDYMFVDNAAMQIILNPKQFDVILTENLFGDIISDEASVIGGSIGILSSASLGNKMGLFEPIHGSFPQATGKNIANPLACIISVSMMLNYLKLEKGAKMIQKAVEKSLIHKITTADLNNDYPYKTSEVGDFITKYIDDNN